MEAFKLVTQQEFYNYVGDKDVIRSIKGSYPYSAIWSIRHRQVVGKTEDYHEYDENCFKKYPVKTRYYLKN